MENLQSTQGMTTDLGGGFLVRRLLPFHQRRMVGPFVFLDHLGPLELIPTRTSDVRPHPHIGLSTLTYLISGRIVHRDSLGNVQTILPGEVNWMTAGKGIVHSERAHADDYGKKVKLEGLQFWVALPDQTEDQDPTFEHYSASEIPKYNSDGFSVAVVSGSAFGLRSPMRVSSPCVFTDFHSTKNCVITFVPELPTFEIAIYVLTGEVTFKNFILSKNKLAVLPVASAYDLNVAPDSHFILIGGEPLKTPRLSWWNFVSSSRDKIKAAALAWKEELFPTIPGDDQERIPLGK